MGEPEEEEVEEREVEYMYELRGTAEAWIHM